MEAGSVASSAEIAVAEPRASWVTAVACRTLDVIVAAMLLIVLLPLFLVIAAVIRYDSKGWVIFRQERVGRRGKRFIINKFRTMGANVDHDAHRTYVLQLINSDGQVEQTAERPLFKMSADQRVTRVGRFLRNSSMDELPQLWNVLRGDMSLVGPRPPIAYEVEHYPPDWFARFAVKPGMTGLWQVSGRSELSLGEMIALDVEYARRRTFRLNLRILLRTIPTVLFDRRTA